ncbi:MAG: hypothetical protein ACXVH6_01890 [Halobacteriota archaeon]
MPDGNQAVTQITKKVTVDGKPFEPLNPCPYPYKPLLDEIPDSLNSVGFRIASEPEEAQERFKNGIDAYQAIFDDDSENSLDNIKLDPTP